MTKLIGIEEHFVTADIRAAWAASSIGREGTGGLDRVEIEDWLNDLGEHRLALMDESGVDVQVLSVTTPALHNLEPGESVSLARRTNDLVAAAVAKYPTRFQGFATLPTAAPEEAAIELERGVTRLGLVGTMPCGRTREKSLDHPAFLPIFATAARLCVPLFVHPQVPQRDVREVYDSGFGDQIDTAFATFALGWHYEAGIQFVRLILGGVLDKYPDLQIILGHWGEVIEAAKRLRFSASHDATSREYRARIAIGDSARHILSSRTCAAEKPSPAVDGPIAREAAGIVLTCRDRRKLVMAAHR